MNHDLGVRATIHKVKCLKAVSHCLQAFGVPDEFMYVEGVGGKKNVNNICNEEVKRKADGL